MLPPSLGVMGKGSGDTCWSDEALKRAVSIHSPCTDPNGLKQA
jgi:hypothetical protein